MIAVTPARSDSGACSACSTPSVHVVHLNYSPNSSTTIRFCEECRRELLMKLYPSTTKIAPIPRSALQRTWDLACEMSREISYLNDAVIEDALDDVKKYFKLKGER